MIWIRWLFTYVDHLHWDRVSATQVYNWIYHKNMLLLRLNCFNLIVHTRQCHCMSSLKFPTLKIADEVVLTVALTMVEKGNILSADPKKWSMRCNISVHRLVAVISSPKNILFGNESHDKQAGGTKPSYDIYRIHCMPIDP